MHKFIYENELRYIEFKVSQGCPISELVRTFENYLKACGFFSEEIEDDFTHLLELPKFMENE